MENPEDTIPAYKTDYLNKLRAQQTVIEEIPDIIK